VIRRAFLALGAWAILTGCGAKPAESDTVYYLVRHAEKTIEKSDPALTPVGKKRAQDLAARLKGVPLTAIYGGPDCSGNGP